MMLAGRASKICSMIASRRSSDSLPVPNVSTAMLTGAATPIA
jgi:hypothetical protein